MVAELAKPDVAALIAEDEEKLFDRTKTQLFFVDEVETSIPDRPPSER